MASRDRPEHQAPPEIFYNAAEARKYTNNSRIQEIQRTMSQRAIELLALPPDSSCLILDLGCGSGLSGQCLTEEGHMWVGLDISPHMLEAATQHEEELEGDLLLGDMGQGMPFRPGAFDGAISISALQWLCNADKKQHSPVKRLYTFFTTLYSSLRRGARAIFQLYPESDKQMELITQQAMRAGFSTAVLTDFPNSSKAKKMYLVLFAGVPVQQLPGAQGTQAANQASNTAREAFKGRKSAKSCRDWILEKKEKQRKRGMEVPRDTKYSGRKRKTLASHR